MSKKPMVVELLTLGKRDHKKFIKAVDNPPEPSPGLKKFIKAMTSSADPAHLLLIEAKNALILLTNNSDPECSLCSGNATTDEKGHTDKCLIRRISAFLEDKK